MRIFVTGTRGIPHIPGGVETHCEHLYPIIAAKGHQVCIATRSTYVVYNENKWQSVHLLRSFSPRLKSIEAIVHTAISLLKARILNPDVVHIHAVGPALLVPLARMLGLNVVFTNHGPDYERQKWGTAAKYMLRLGEKLGGMYANEVIVISTVIRDIVKKRCNRDSNLILNGVVIPAPIEKSNYIESLGVTPGKYIVAVARFVPEKGLTDLITAYLGLQTEHKLVIAGDADHETSYSKNLKEIAGKSDRIVLTGYISGEKLKQVFGHATLFVLPSYHEGLPISLLEAMSYGLAVLVSDIAANREVNLESTRYFRCGDISDLRQKLGALLLDPISKSEKEKQFALLAQKYDWNKIAEQTIEVYEKAAYCRSARKTDLEYDPASNSPIEKLYLHNKRLK